MARLTDLPDELLSQILSHNVPSALRTRSDFPTHVRSHAANKRLLRLARDAFFHTFTHALDLSCLYTVLSPRCAYTQVHTDGTLSARRSFCAQVRRVHLRVHVYYSESVGVAVKEVEGVLERYGSLASLRVGLRTGCEKVATELEGRIGEVLEEWKRGVERRVETFLARC